MAIQAASVSPSPDRGQVNEGNPSHHSAKTVERIALSLLRQAQKTPEISRRLDSFLFKHEIGKQSEKPLVDALIGGKINMTQCFEELGVDRASYEKMANYSDELGDDINKMDANGQTPLTRAVADGDIEKVRLLVDLGADINQTNAEGRTLLDEAVLDQKPERIKLLLKFGAKLNQIDINKPDVEGVTRLDRAIINENPEMIKLLVKLGATISTHDLIHRLFSINWYVRKEKTEMIQFLVELGVNINQCDAQDVNPNLTPLWTAIINEKPEMIKLLVKLGANINQYNKNGITPLNWAIIKGKPEMIKLLVELGADLNSCDTSGWTPYALAKSRALSDMEDLLSTFDGHKQPGKYTPLDLELSEECWHQKRIAAAWGLTGSTSLRRQTQTLESGFPTFGLSLTKECLTHFLDKKPEGMTPANRKLIIDAFENGFTPNQANAEVALERINKHEPVCILGGTQRHSIGILIYQGHIAICNRGRGSDGKEGVTFYQPKTPITKEMIEGLMERYDDIESFDAMVNSTLEVHGKPLPQGHQKSGNCYFASAKSMLYALAHMLDPATAKDFYKEFTAFSREYVVEDYLAHVPKERRNEHLLSMVHEKCMKKVELKKPHFVKGLEETLFKTLEAFRPSPEFLDDSLGFSSPS